MEWALKIPALLIKMLGVPMVRLMSWAALETAAGSVMSQLKNLM
jgi:hypothetical protein